MGTNYYLKSNEQVITVYPSWTGKPVDLKPLEIHLGKRSMGWRFTLHGGIQNIFGIEFKIESLEDIKNLYFTGRWKITNEYEDECSFEEFVQMVNETKNQKLNSYDYHKEKGYSVGDVKKDKNGFSWCYYDFS